jgi:heat shock protein 4
MTSVVGIDLGYQNSLIAAAGRGGVDVLLNGNSQRLNPYVFQLVDWIVL